MNINPNELAKHAINIESHSGWSLNLIAPFTRKELEKKKIKKSGKYIIKTRSISG